MGRNETTTVAGTVAGTAGCSGWEAVSLLIMYEQKARILNRLFSHKDTSPFILITDSLSQPGIAILNEFLVSPECPQTSQDLDSDCPLIIIPDLSTVTNIAQSIQKILTRGARVIAIYHCDLEPEKSYAPSTLALAEYMATTIIKVLFNQDLQLQMIENPMLRFKIHSDPQMVVEVINRRKSGNAVVAQYSVDTQGHTCSMLAKTVQEDDPSQLAGLTTFNLDLTEEQRAKRDKVELPFMAAQEVGDGGASGGAIIYQFEKDDDYDEEDPYEDPI